MDVLLDPASLQDLTLPFQRRTHNPDGPGQDLDEVGEGILRALAVVGNQAAVCLHEDQGGEAPHLHVTTPT